MKKIFVRGILRGTTTKRPSDIKRSKGFHKELAPDSFNFFQEPAFLKKAA